MRSSADRDRIETGLSRAWDGAVWVNMIGPLGWSGLDASSGLVAALAGARSAELASVARRAAHGNDHDLSYPERSRSRRESECRPVHGPRLQHAAELLVGRDDRFRYTFVIEAR